MRVSLVLAIERLSPHSLVRRSLSVFPHWYLAPVVDSDNTFVTLEVLEEGIFLMVV